MGRAHQFEVAGVVVQQSLHGLHLRIGRSHQQRLAGDLTGQGQVRGFVTMLLQVAKGLLLFDEPLVATEDIEVETDPWPDRIEVRDRGSLALCTRWRPAAARSRPADTAHLVPQPPIVMPAVSLHRQRPAPDCRRWPGVPVGRAWASQMADHHCPVTLLPRAMRCDSPGQGAARPVDRSAATGSSAGP